MRYALFLLAVLFLLVTSSYSQQTTVAEWFPVHQGDKWIYEHETRDPGVNGNLPPFEIHHWKTEETVTGLWVVPEGELVEVQVQVTDADCCAVWNSCSWKMRAFCDPLASAPRDKAKTGWAEVYLIHNIDCLYRDVGWDSSTHQLTADYRQYLDRDISPDFCFPFAVGKTWGAPHYLSGYQERPPSEAKDWEVVEINPQDVDAPDKQETFHITSVSSYLGSGMTNDIWLEKGVGIIREESIHHGTIGEERTHLVSFEPSRQN